MTVALPDAFVRVPLTHRAYHDATDGRPENSRAAISAAIEAGYGIEVDVQMSADGQAMVFHDFDLGRLTDAQGPIRQRSQAELAEIALTGGDGETIPTLTEILALVSGRVPILIEVKDQDGAMGTDVGPLEEATARALHGYLGDVAVMSFNPHSVAAFADLAPHLPRGLTTSNYAAEDWPLSAAVRDHLRDFPDFERIGASFLSHEAADLSFPKVQAFRARGVPVLTWTIRSEAEEDAARHLCDNITFEGYAAAFPT